MNVSGVWNCDFFDLCFAAVNGHHGESNLLIEPALAAASRIQPEDAIRHLLGVFMRMTVDHYIRVVQVFGHKLPVMNHKESALLNLKGQTFWYVLCPFFIVIAANDVDRRDFLQSVNDFRFVDVATVNDYIAAGDSVQYFRAKQGRAYPKELLFLLPSAQPPGSDFCDYNCFPKGLGSFFWELVS